MGRAAPRGGPTELGPRQPPRGPGVSGTQGSERGGRPGQSEGAARGGKIRSAVPSSFPGSTEAGIIRARYHRRFIRRRGETGSSPPRAPPGRVARACWGRSGGVGGGGGGGGSELGGVSDRFEVPMQGMLLEIGGPEGRPR